MKLAAALVALALTAPRIARADCRCVSIAGDVGAAVQADAIRADSLYAKGDFAGALALYGKGFAQTKDAAFLYAEAMCQWQLGRMDDAKALLEQYLGAGGELAFRAKAEGALGDVRAGVTATVGNAADAAGFVGGSALAGGAELRAETHPPKIAHGAAVVVGVVAIAAVAIVGVQSIRAGLSDDVDLDPKMDLSLGASAVVLGGTALYLSTLTATAGSVSGAGGNLHCVAPVAYPGGGGVAALVSF